MRVDQAGTEDIAGLVELRLAYLREDAGSLSEGEAGAIRRELPGYFRAHLGRDLFAHVVRDGRTIVACALLLTVEKPMSPAFINGKTGIVLNVYTRPEYRRRGCARMAMRALLCDAAERELCTIELKATEDGYPLYRSLGFVEDHSKYRPMKWKRAQDSEEEGK